MASAVLPPAGDSAPERWDKAELDLLCARNLLELFPEAVYFKDLDSRFIRVSKGQAERLGVTTPEEVIGRTDSDFFNEVHARKALRDETEIIRTGQPLLGIEERLTMPDHPDMWVSVMKLPLRDDSGRVIGTFGVSHDITRRVEAEQLLAEHAQELASTNAQLLELQRDLRTLIDNSPDLISQLDNDLRYVYINPATEAVFGRSVEETVGHTDRELGHPQSFLEVWEPALRRVVSSGEGAIIEFAAPTPAGLRWLESRLVPQFSPDGAVRGVMAATRDLTERKRAEEALAHQAVHDPVTGLANRKLLRDRIEQAIGRLTGRSTLAVLFLDLDRFKVVNDSLGHATGDWLLTQVAARLRRISRRQDTIARFGGDEFVVLCNRLDGLDTVRLVAERIRAEIEKPYLYRGREIHVGVSIGIATATTREETAETLLRDADAAMYRAKEIGRGRIQFFDAHLRERAVERHEVEQQLREAIKQREFRLVYQPLLAIDGGRIIGAEALIRWDHPERGLLSPADFMSLAEETRLIVPIGEWVLEEACQQLSEWSAIDPAFSMAVNVSACQLSERGLVAKVAELLVKHAITPDRLCIEVTETALLDEGRVVEQVLVGLAGLGVRIALDDFGTGYSSLGHLRRFSVDILKIDRAFVGGLGRDAGDTAIVAAVTAMARALGMTTVGEGIETPEQLQALRELGCDHSQGYLLGRPMPPADLGALLHA